MAIEQRTAGPLVMYGIIGGIVAGIVFAIAEMVMAVIMGGAFTDPLRLISSIVLGVDALSPTYPVVTATVVSIIVHLVLSSIFGVIFFYLLGLFNQLDSPAALLLLYGSLFGLVLWIVNFLIIAPIFFPQFTLVDQFWNGFVAHTFFYGTVIGGYAASVLPGRAGAALR